MLIKNYLFSDDLLMRSPVGKQVNYTLDHEVILQDEIFLSALQIASPQFYQKIILKGIKDQRLLLTLRRYFNRYCFRATPFGLFAGVSLISWSSSLASSDEEELKLFIAADDRLRYLLTDLTQNHPDGRFEPNPTIYTVDKEYRFIHMETDVLSGKRKYLLQATDRTDILTRLLQFCKQGKSTSELKLFIRKKSNCDPEEADEYLVFLKDAQVVWQQDSNIITGPPETLSRFPEAGRIYPFSPGLVKRLHKNAEAALGERKDSSGALMNVVCVKNGSIAGLDDTVQKTLSEGIWALAQLSGPLKNPNLEKFITTFNDQFEGQQVPLLDILDPEIGIGYGAEQNETGNLLLEKFDVSPLQQSADGGNWTRAHQYLMNAWHDRLRPDPNVIRLDETELEMLGSIKKDERSAGFSVLFRICGTDIWIDSAGGYHANALLGRFTPASETVLTAAKRIAKHEQELNRDIRFAEILHLTDLRTDNVNRRERILDLEIPVTASSGLPVQMQIPLSDLLVSVVSGQVLLHSKTNGSTVVPRQSSAYNHGLNGLPLYRFLADLPYQFAAPVHQLDLSKIFPGLDHYPRIVFKSAVLSPARWILHQEEIHKSLGNAKGFEELRRQRGIPHLFLLIEGDHHLFFNIGSEDQLEFFFDCVKGKMSVHLQEIPTDGLSGSMITKQLNAFVLPEKALKLPPSPVKTNLTSNKRKFLPGSEWLYLKLYSSRLTADKVLSQLAPYLKRQVRHGIVQKWFFVRYEDHAPHLRLRLLIEPSHIGSVLVALRVLFEKKVERNVIREYQLDTYSRELERYGIPRFEEVEDVFWSSSMLTLCYLTGRHAMIHKEPHLFALASVSQLTVLAFPDPEERVNFYKKRFLQFRQEFNDDKINISLDKKFRALRSGIDAVLGDENYFRKLHLNTHQQRCMRTFNTLIGRVSPGSADYEDLINAILHMHLNRIFISESRKQEMMVFYFLYKQVNSALAVQKKVLKY